MFSTFACGDSMFPRVVKKPPSQEEFDMLINEQGWKYAEKITFDMIKKTVVHHVPAHRHLNESNVMEDFVSNLTVTRIPSQGVCYVRPKTPEEPSLDVLKKSMDKVSGQKYKIKDGFETIAIQWVITRKVDVSILGKDVIEFCRGMEIYEVEEYKKDGAKVLKAISRKKRDKDWVLCRPWSVVKEELKKCDRSQWKLKCKFTTQNCFHYITCTGTWVQLRDQCTSTHKYDDFVCCTPSCP